MVYVREARKGRCRLVKQAHHLHSIRRLWTDVGMVWRSCDGFIAPLRKQKLPLTLVDIDGLAEMWAMTAGDARIWNTAADACAPFAVAGLHDAPTFFPTPCVISLLSLTDKWPIARPRNNPKSTRIWEEQRTMSDHNEQ